MASALLDAASNGIQSHVTEADLWLDKLPEDLKSILLLHAILQLS
jgi:hypothetical protein